MSRITLHVRGIPKAWGNNEWKWREAVAQEARLSPQNQARAITPTTRLDMVIIFNLLNDRVLRPDLDNLAKPVLDTLFRIRNAQVSDLSLTGALFDVDDDHVFRLTLEKRPVEKETDEGAEITITWNEPGQTR